MRWVVLLLLIANLLLFGFTRLETRAAAPNARSSNQLDPEKIKVLTPQQVAALGPAKVAALVDVCVEWGPFSDVDRTRALSELESLQLGRLLSQRRVDDSAFWVTLGPFVNRGAADKRVGELRAQGVSDVSAVDTGKGQFAVSLGVFRTAQAASARADALSRQGVAGARVEPRPPLAPQTMLVIRDPQQSVVARMKELQPQYVGSDVRVGACPATS